MIEAPHILMIGSAGKACGKTTLACALIRKFGRKYPIAAFKVTPCGPGHSVPRTGYELIEETTPDGIKDTQRMRAAGAQRAYWIRVAPDALAACADALLEMIGKGCLCVCESNRLRTIIRPGLFLMLRAEDRKCEKPSAEAVWRDADRVIVSTGSEFDLDLDEISIIAGRWRLGDAASGRAHFNDDTF